MFVEEGVNGAHQDPQYNVLYRNINMIRSFVDAAEAKKVMAFGGMLQIDGAHNANATAKIAWKVMPELLVQHAINCVFSLKAGIDKEHIALSTVPPIASPAPDLRINLPFAVALRDFFSDFKIRAQMNTKYMESSTREATVTHVLNLLISKLTSADIQSTITPDEGRNVPWHMYNIEALDTAKQALIGMDGLKELVEIKNTGYMKEKVREIKERAVLFLEEIKAAGGYFSAVEKGFFIDSGYFPERVYDGLKRSVNGGIGAGTVYPRDHDYFAPVLAHFGYNNTMQFGVTPDEVTSLIGGCTFEDRSKIQYIDKLDEIDNVNTRLDETEQYRSTSLIKPEVEWLG
ncbi:MAG TPA: lysine 5,6-aminomutase subunit alpha, partial [Bacilli bacterium]|nr:lysine 5,6-aminomutase subunit alpha [Bacilli bacterium]